MNISGASLDEINAAHHSFPRSAISYLTLQYSYKQYAQYLTLQYSHIQYAQYLTLQYSHIKCEQ